jgi:hypothetical protein
MQGAALEEHRLLFLVRGGFVSLHQLHHMNAPFGADWAFLGFLPEQAGLYLSPIVCYHEVYEVTYHPQTIPTAIEQLAPVDTSSQR